MKELFVCNNYNEKDKSCRQCGHGKPHTESLTCILSCRRGEERGICSVIKVKREKFYKIIKL